MAQREQRFTSLEAWRAAYGVVEEPKDIERPVVDLSLFKSLPVIKKLQSAERARVGMLPQRDEMISCAVREALEMSQVSREKAGIRPVVFLPDELVDNPSLPDDIHYPIYVLFPQGTKHAFLMVSRPALQRQFKADPTRKFDINALHQVDERVRQAAEVRPETLEDRYGRLLREVKLVDSKIRSNKRQTEAESDVTIYTAGQLTRRLKTRAQSAVDHLNDRKHQKLISYFDTARELQPVYPSNLYIIESGDDRFHQTLIMRTPTELNTIRRLLNYNVPPLLSERFNEERTNLNLALVKKMRDAFIDGSTAAEDKTAFDLCLRLGI